MAKTKKPKKRKTQRKTIEDQFTGDNEIDC